MLPAARFCWRDGWWRAGSSMPQPIGKLDVKRVFPTEVADVLDLRKLGRTERHLRYAARLSQSALL